MGTLKFIGIFLAIMLLVFMIKGMIFGAMIFFYILKLAFICAIITFIIYQVIKFRK